jgi:hypothetical protein
VDNPSEQLPVTISPDARAYTMLLAVFSPLFVIWGLAWLKKGSVVAPTIILIGGLVVIGLCQLRNKTLELDDCEIVQGWLPFRTSIQYHEIARIHHIFVSSRYGSSPCLAISTGPKNKKIVVPMRSFNLTKRRQLVGILKVKAPQARFDPNVPT